MKRILCIVCSSLIILSCNTEQTKTTETRHNFEKDKSTLYVITIFNPKLESKQVAKLDELPPVKKDEIRSVTANYFNISLNELPDKSGYLAQRNVIEPTSNVINSNIEYICDWCGAKTIFKTTAGFLSFMLARGYELARQTENIHGKDYVFNKI